MSAEAFQDSSALMKRAAFQALAIGVVAVILYMFCVEPSQTALQKAQAERASLDDQRNRTARDLKDAGHVEERLKAIKAESKVYMDGLLKPSHESYYWPSAKKLLDPIAEDAGVSIGNFSQLTERRLPLPVPLSPQLYARQPIRMTCTGSYAAIVSFILRVEKKLPLVALEALSIKPQKEQPDIQTANIILEWPIKGENTADTAKGGVKK